MEVTEIFFIKGRQVLKVRLKFGLKMISSTVFCECLGVEKIAKDWQVNLFCYLPFSAVCVCVCACFDTNSWLTNKLLDL